ncbi:hypothetical protein [Zhihengliuella sp. ISTPL4]|uniref:hypothetical protein n=1 Tax=Zhihengliuella sp. ISTPL4 TaxID=2058657 RepID=UPI000C7D82F0|nr:hypothetical protein [Zhihengliuella sp. ISTPL4]
MKTLSGERGSGAPVAEQASSAPLSSPSRLQRLFLSYPVSVALSLPYVLLILPQAVWNQNEHLGFLIGVLALALAGAVFVEALVGILRSSGRRARAARTAANVDATFERLNAYGPALRRSAYFVTVVGVVVGVVSAAAGIGSIQSQVGLVAVSAPLSMASALVGGWPTIGSALLVAARMARQLSARSFWSWIGILVVGQALEAYLTAVTATLMTFATSLMMMLLLFGIIRVRFALVTLLIVLIAWPIAFDIRNGLRESSGVAVSADVDAFDRLRFDLQITRAAEIRDIPLELGQPGPIEIVRYGLVPRALDPERPPISTGIKINMYLGGSATSSYTFLPVTTAYVLGGPVYLVLWYGFWALLAAIVLRGGRDLSVLRIVLMGLLLSGPLGWFSTFPDRTIGVLQFLVSFLPVLLYLALEKTFRQRRRGAMSTAHPQSERRRT